MYEVFQCIKSLLKLEEVRIDNNVFRLHYKVTMILLLIFSLINTSRQYIGDPIDCVTDDRIPQKIMDTYCWITATFTVPNKFKLPGVKVLYPGVVNHVTGEDTIKHHKFYQWVCFVLFFQAILFYVPRYLWKNWEGGKLRSLVGNLKMISLEPTEMIQRCDALNDYFYLNLHCHNFYFFRFVFCELLNLINVICQMFLIDCFLGGEFSSYGWQVVTFTEMDHSERIDPMSLVFPKVAKCTFYRYGVSSTIENIDGLCVLPVNVVNEKIYVFLWFWFIFLASVTTLALIYRGATVLSWQLRTTLLRARCRLNSTQQIEELCRRFQIGDWFMFYLISHNIDPIALKRLIKDLNHRLNNKTNFK